MSQATLGTSSGPQAVRLENFLVCPITQELFIDPVLAEDGHTYERTAITRWFGTGNTRSPVTNEELAGKRLVPNHVIKKVVHHHRHGLGLKLVSACERGEDAEVIELIERGADLNARTESGETPLLLLIARSKLDLARTLIQTGADASLSNDRGETPEAAARRRRLDPSFVSFLQDAGRTAAQKRATEAEHRLKERDEYRRVQEQRRAEGGGNDATGGLGAGGGGGVMPLVQGIGFFPSLFGLQFQGALVTADGNNNNNNNPPTPGMGMNPPHHHHQSFAISQRLTHWARINIAGDPELATGQEDHIQQQILSRALLTVGSMVLLCLLLL